MNVKNPQNLISYFRLEKKNLFLVTVTGIIYNIGMTAGPYFEGRLAQCLYDIISGRGVWMDMLILATIYLAVILLVQVNRAFKRFYVRRFANNTSKNMRHMLYNSIVHMSKHELEEEQLGNVMTKAISDVDACVEGMRKFTTEVFDTGIVLVAYAVLLCIYDFRLTLVSCIFIPVAYIIAAKCKGIITKYNEIYKKSSGRLNQTTMDLVGKEVTYRVFGLEEKRQRRYEGDLTNYEKNAVRANVWESALQPIYYIITMGGAVVIFYFGSRNVLGNGWTAWDIGAFTTFFSCFAKLAVKASKSAKLFNSVQKANVSWKRIKPMFREYIENEKEDIEKIGIKKEESSGEGGKDIGVTLEHVNIFYPGQDAILRDISYTASAGQMIGITGEVASGKSAIGKLFIGEVNYDGKVEVHGQVSYMGHEPELLSTSIEENILLGMHMQNAQQEKMFAEACLEKVRLDEEIKAMPEGISTRVGEGGVRLSGGQQSRLALARLMAHGKEILVLDDPFAAVDKKTEKQIFEELKAMTTDKVTLLISHRLTLFPQMDGILFLHGGSADFGTHEELMNSQPEYAKLYCLQGGGQHA